MDASKERFSCLSDKRILEEMKNGNIVIHPFEKKNLNTCSYDMTLGEFFFRERPPSPGSIRVCNIYDEEHSSMRWGDEPQKAMLFKKLKSNPELVDKIIETSCARLGLNPASVQIDVYRDFENINDNDKVILVFPGESILGHTEEYIGGTRDITTMVRARSTIGRSMIDVTKSAGWGDVGFCNRWSLNITNHSSHYIFPLVVGRRVAQMVFFEVGPIEGDDYTKSGKYSHSVDIEELKKSWTPQSLVPKAHKDRDIQKNK